MVDHNFKRISSAQKLPVPVDAIVLFRTWTILAGLFYSMWSLLVVLLLPGVYDAPSERLVISAVFLCVAGSTWHPAFPKRMIDLFTVALSILYFLHFLSLVYRSENFINYLFATLVVIAVVSTGFRRATHYLLYSMFVLMVEAIYAWRQDFDQELSVCFVGFSGTLLAAFYCLLYLREKSERQTNQLLHNILPTVVVERLKAQRGQFTERTESVTVLFADIVGFTQLTRSMEATQLIEHLDELFSRFDEATEELGVEKIKTIGDCYMAVCGAPEEDPNHQTRMIEFALRILEILQDFRVARGLDMELRIGVHSGPIVAGVIGSKKTVYDLWGDTVNLASRMESHGQPGRIQASVETAQGITAIEFSEPFTVDLKGIGPVRACFVESRASSGKL